MAEITDYERQALIDLAFATEPRDGRLEFILSDKEASNLPEIGKGE